MSDITIKSPDYATKEFAIFHGWQEMVPKNDSTVEFVENPITYQQFALDFLQNFHDVIVIDKKVKEATKIVIDDAKQNAKDTLAQAKGEPVEHDADVAVEQ